MRTTEATDDKGRRQTITDDDGRRRMRTRAETSTSMHTCTGVRSLAAAPLSQRQMPSGINGQLPALHAEHAVSQGINPALAEDRDIRFQHLHWSCSPGSDLTAAPASWQITAVVNSKEQAQAFRRPKPECPWLGADPQTKSVAGPTAPGPGSKRP